MWSPKRIKFTNLFSHKDSEYQFLDGKCVIISGENRSDRSLNNNGAGKTTLFEAITIALTNESLRNIKKDDFINKEEDESPMIINGDIFISVNNYGGKINLKKIRKQNKTIFFILTFFVIYLCDTRFVPGIVVQSRTSFIP